MTNLTLEEAAKIKPGDKLEYRPQDSINPPDKIYPLIVGDKPVEVEDVKYYGYTGNIKIYRQVFLGRFFGTRSIPDLSSLESISFTIDEGKYGKRDAWFGYFRKVERGGK